MILLIRVTLSWVDPAVVSTAKGVDYRFAQLWEHTTGINSNKRHQNLAFPYNCSDKTCDNTLDFTVSSLG